MRFDILMLLTKVVNLLRILFTASSSLLKSVKTYKGWHYQIILPFNYNNNTCFSDVKANGKNKWVNVNCSEYNRKTTAAILKLPTINLKGENNL